MLYRSVSAISNSKLTKN